MQLLLTWGQSIYLKGRHLKDNQWIRLFFQIIILLACFYYLYKNASDLKNSLYTNNWNGWYLLLAALSAYACNLLGVLSWQWILSGLGHPISRTEAAIAQLSPVLTKYLPGSMWPYLGRTYLTTKLGVPVKTVGVGLLFEFIEIIVSGIIFSLLVAPVEIIRLLPGWTSQSLLRLFGVCLILLNFWIISEWKKSHNRKMTGADDSTQIRLWPLTWAFVIYIVAWIVFGISLWSAARSISILPIQALPLTASAYAIAYLIGLLILVAPNGLGIREGVLVLLLGAVLTGSQAVLVSILSRLMILVGDLIATGTAFLLRKTLHTRKVPPK